MLTPQEVQDKKFPKSLFSGYDMGEVDDFLDAVSVDYAALYKENVVLKNKLKVLAEKIEEYRSVDAAMRKALLAAQKMAAEITEEAKTKSEQLRMKAQSDYENSISALKDSIKNEERRLEKLREETSRFAEASIIIYQRQIDTLKRMVTEPAVKKPSPVDQTVEIIEQSVKQAIHEEIPGVPTRSAEPSNTYNVEKQQDLEAAAPVNEPSTAAEYQDQTDIDSIPIEKVKSNDTIIERDNAFVTAHSETIVSDSSDSGYNNYDLSTLFPSDTTSEDTEQDTFNISAKNNRGRDQRKPRDVNVGGMSVRVFEMDLSSDKKDDNTI
jgi:cell division initiation protein